MNDLDDLLYDGMEVEMQDKLTGEYLYRLKQTPPPHPNYQAPCSSSRVWAAKSYWEALEIAKQAGYPTEVFLERAKVTEKVVDMKWEVLRP